VDLGRAPEVAVADRADQVREEPLRLLAVELVEETPADDHVACRRVHPDGGGIRHLGIEEPHLRRADPGGDRHLLHHVDELALLQIPVSRRPCADREEGVADPGREPNGPDAQPARDRDDEPDHPDRRAVARQELRQVAHDPERGKPHVPDDAGQAGRRGVQKEERADPDGQDRGDEHHGEEDEEHVGEEADGRHEPARSHHHGIGRRETPRRAAIPRLELEGRRALGRPGLRHVRAMIPSGPGHG